MMKLATMEVSQALMFSKNMEALRPKFDVLPRSSVGLCLNTLCDAPERKSNLLVQLLQYDVLAGVTKEETRAVLHHVRRVRSKELSTFLRWYTVTKESPATMRLLLLAKAEKRNALWQELALDSQPLARADDLLPTLTTKRLVNAYPDVQVKKSLRRARTVLNDVHAFTWPQRALLAKVQNDSTMQGRLNRTLRKLGLDAKGAEDGQHTLAGYAWAAIEAHLAGQTGDVATQRRFGQALRFAFLNALDSENPRMALTETLQPVLPELSSF